MGELFYVRQACVNIYRVKVPNALQPVVGVFTEHFITLDRHLLLKEILKQLQDGPGLETVSFS